VPGERQPVGGFAVWVEPALVAEWCRLMRVYAGRQERTLDEGVLAAAMTWFEPDRGVVLPRARAEEIAPMWWIVSMSKSTKSSVAGPKRPPARHNKAALAKGSRVSRASLF
jgi:hypothetical protein